MKPFQCIHILRFSVCFISLVALSCHLSQCLLLNTYREKNNDNIPDWLTAGHWQYLIWYIALGLSLAGSFVMCLSATYYNRPTKYSLDKGIGSLAILPVLASVITAKLSGSIEPWTDGHVKVERSGLVNSCYLLDATRDQFYPVLYQRCMLSEATWICAVILCINWAILVGFTMYVSKNSLSSSPSTIAMTKNLIGPAIKEPKWGRYIPDPPSSIYSATTLGHRSGLLTPFSTLTKEKHSEFYYNCSRENTPSLPPPSPYREYSSDYLLKGGGSDYLDKNSFDSYNNTTASNTNSPSSAYNYGETLQPPLSCYYKYTSNYKSNERFNNSGDKRRTYNNIDNDKEERENQGKEEDEEKEEEDEKEEEEEVEEEVEGRKHGRYDYSTSRNSNNKYNSQKLLRVNTATAYQAPSHSLPGMDKEPESPTTVSTPLYKKFSSKSPTFDLLSDKKYHSYY